MSCAPGPKTGNDSEIKIVSTVFTYDVPMTWTQDTVSKSLLVAMQTTLDPLKPDAECHNPHMSGQKECEGDLPIVMASYGIQVHQQRLRDYHRQDHEFDLSVRAPKTYRFTACGRMVFWKVVSARRIPGVESTCRLPAGNFWMSNYQPVVGKPFRFVAAIDQGIRPLPTLLSFKCHQTVSSLGRGKCTIIIHQI